MEITVALPSASRDCAMSGTQAGEQSVLTEPQQRRNFPCEVRSHLPLLQGPVFRCGLPYVWCCLGRAAGFWSDCAIGLQFRCCFALSSFRYAPEFLPALASNVDRSVGSL